MSVTITIPDEIALVLGSAAEEREQRARETIALELYRQGKITLRTMGRLAGVGEDYWAADAFRARHGLPAISPADTVEDDEGIKILQP
jgi:hypothetical protein